jgi:hypothetical protein
MSIAIVGSVIISPREDARHDYNRPPTGPADPPSREIMARCKKLKIRQVRDCFNVDQSQRVGAYADDRAVCALLYSVFA